MQYGLQSGLRGFHGNFLSRQIDDPILMCGVWPDEADHCKDVRPVVAHLRGRRSEFWCGRLCLFRSVRQRKSLLPAPWGMRLCRSGMPLVLPLTLRWVWVFGVSCTSPVRIFCSDSVSSPIGVVARCVLESSSERDRI